MRDEIRRICKEFGLTAVYVTHDQKEALAIADRIAVMKSGRVLQVGAPAEIYRAPVSREVAGFIGETNLLEGTVLDESSTGLRIRTALGELLSTGPLARLPARGPKFGCRSDRKASPSPPILLRRPRTPSPVHDRNHDVPRRNRRAPLSIGHQLLRVYGSILGPRAARRAPPSFPTADVTVLPFDGSPR